MSEIRKKIFLLSSYLMIMASITGCSKVGEYQFNYDDSESIYDDIDNDETKEQFDNEIEENNKLEVVNINDFDELTKYLGYENVSFDEVKNAVLNNDKLKDNQKEKILDLLYVLEQKAPDTDLRCFYENVKKLKIEKINMNEMCARGHKNVTGYFSPEKHKIVLLKEIGISTFRHECLHMLNNLDLDVNNVKIKKNFCDEQNNYSSLKEGFTEWLNLYLYPNECYSYSEQVADINIIKYILDDNNQELIDDFTKFNYQNIVCKLFSILTDADVVTLLKICDCEKQILTDQDELVKATEIEKKYDILTRAIILSKGGNLSNDEVLNYYQLLYNSFSYYLGTIYDDDKNLDNNIISNLKSKIFKTLLNHGNDTQNNINIKNKKNNIIYNNINNLYVGYNNADGGIKNVLVEEYNDLNEEQQYLDLINLEPIDMTSYTFVPVVDLIPDIGLNNNSIKLVDLYNTFNNNYIISDIKTYSY